MAGGARLPRRRRAATLRASAPRPPPPRSAAASRRAALPSPPFPVPTRPARAGPAAAPPPPLIPAERLAAGLAAAAVVALLARRARALAPGGAVAATVVGALAVGAGWGWGVLLVAFFVASTALSRLGSAAKAARTEGIVAKGGERDARQVLANGGAFALAAAGALLLPHPAWAPFGVGALAAAAADTWGTEIGTLASRAPRSLRGWRPVPPGTSGAISAAGTLASVAGAIFVATVALVAAFPVAVAGAAALGGIAGALADSLLGAWLQARRHCPRCACATERNVHTCGERTLAAGGLRWLDNDVVNLLAAVAGGLVAVLAA